MKNLFKKTENEETKKVTEENEEETTPVEEEENKKKTVPTWLKVAAAGIGVTLGAIGLSKLFGHGSAPIEYFDLDEDGESEDSEETSDSETPAETENQAESAE